MEELALLESGENLLKKLSQSAKNKLATETADLWRVWTTQIDQLLEESVEGWQLYAEGVPRTNVVSGSTRDSKTVKEQKRKGVRLGFVARSVDSIHSVQHNSTFPVDERFFDGKPKNEAAKEHQDLYETWKTDNLAEIDFQGAMNAHRKNTLIDGTAVFHAPYRVKKKRKVYYEPMFPIPFVKTYPDWFLVRKEDPEYICWEGTEAEPLNFTDWRADPNCANFDENCGFIRRYYLPTWKVKRDFKLKEVNSYHSSIDFYDRDKERKQALGINDWSIGKSEGEGKEQALLMVRYDNFVIDGKVYENHVLIILNDSETIYFDKNRYDHGRKPYCLTPYNRIPGSVYGKSAIRDILSIAQTCDVSATQLIDIMHWAAKPVWEKDVSDPLVAAMGDIEIKPGLQIPMKNLGSIRQIQINTISNAEPLLLLLEKLENYIGEQTGGTPVFSGGDPGQGKIPTAYQVGAHVEGGNNRFQERMTTFNDTALDPYMYMNWCNDQQYMSKTYMVPGFSEPLTPAIVKQMEMDWTITATQASMNRQREIANLREILTSFPELEKMGILRRKQEVGELDVLGVIKQLYQKAGVESETFLRIMSLEQPGTMVTPPGQQVIDVEGAPVDGLPAGGGVDQQIPGSGGGVIPGIAGDAGLPNP